MRVCSHPVCHSGRSPDGSSPSSPAATPVGPGRTGRETSRRSCPITRGCVATTGRDAEGPRGCPRQRGRRLSTRQTPRVEADAAVDARNAPTAACKTRGRVLHSSHNASSFSCTRSPRRDYNRARTQGGTGTRSVPGGGSRDCSIDWEAGGHRASIHPRVRTSGGGQILPRTCARPGAACRSWLPPPRRRQHSQAPGVGLPSR